MLKYYVEAVKRLRTDKDGVVSFEYVIVAACCRAPWSLLLFQGTGANTLTGALTTGFTAIADRYELVSNLSPERGIGMSQCHASFEACI